MIPGRSFFLSRVGEAEHSCIEILMYILMAVDANQKVFSHEHSTMAQILATKFGFPDAALRRWLETMAGRPAEEREATLGLVRNLAAARDVSNEKHILPLLSLLLLSFEMLESTFSSTPPSYFRSTLSSFSMISYSLLVIGEIW